MLNTFARPAFAGKARTPDYYITVRRIVDTLRETASLATIAAHLNSCGISSPKGKPWAKQTVANFLRNTSIK